MKLTRFAHAYQFSSATKKMINERYYSKNKRDKNSQGKSVHIT